MTHKTDRRAFLRTSSGFLLALPAGFAFWRDQLVFAQTPSTQRNLITFSFPNGCARDLFDQSLIAPLQARAADFLFVKNLTNAAGLAKGGDGHETGGACLFTAVGFATQYQMPGPSLDTVFRARSGQKTVLDEPLVAGVWRAFAGGLYRQPVWYRRSWTQNGAASGVAPQPIDLFNRVFGGDGGDGRREAMHASVLDLVKADATSLLGERSQLGAAGKAALTDYLDGVRSLEKRAAALKAAQNSCEAGKTAPSRFGVDGQGLLAYASFHDAFRRHIDLIVAALACGYSDAASLTFGSAGEEYQRDEARFKIAGSVKPDHECSHYNNHTNPTDANAAKAVYIAYRHYYMEQLLYLVDQIKAAGIWENTVVVAGTEFGESNVHEIGPQPHILAGAPQRIALGKTLDVDGGAGLRTPGDLYRTVLKALGIDVATFGDASHNRGLLDAILA